MPRVKTPHAAQLEDDDQAPLEAPVFPGMLEMFDAPDPPEEAASANPVLALANETWHSSAQTEALMTFILNRRLELMDEAAELSDKDSVLGVAGRAHAHKALQEVSRLIEELGGHLTENGDE